MNAFTLIRSSLSKPCATWMPLLSLRTVMNASTPETPDPAAGQEPLPAPSRTLRSALESLSISPAEASDCITQGLERLFHSEDGEVSADEASALSAIMNLWYCPTRREQAQPLFRVAASA